MTTTLTVALSLTGQTQDITVLELHPAPGQFINTLPEATETSTHEEVCAAATESLRNGELIHLGTYGGYITVEFDHPVKNLPGSDLRITGNGFYAAADPVYGSETIGGSFEPGIVYVGVGDNVKTAKWYELAGWEYYDREIHDFSITYHKPTAETGEHKQPFSLYDDYLYWEASWTENGELRDSVGYHIKNSFHRQSYWPLWEEGETLTFKGGKLPNNGIDQSGKGNYWVLYRYAPEAYGYVDCSLNSDDYSTFDIDWAVDDEGKPVVLDEINFIRVATGIFQYCGWLGETSTEVSGFHDLHLDPGYDDNPIFITRRDLLTVTPILDAAATGDDDIIYDLQGRRVTNPGPGLYIRNRQKILIR
ncbi:MAG: PKD domain-containing protein [Muribaculaceae bacterium]|nr:PKD domain-containing protein [Muribaculaceae bacterium]